MFQYLIQHHQLYHFALAKKKMRVATVFIQTTYYISNKMVVFFVLFIFSGKFWQIGTNSFEKNVKYSKWPSKEHPIHVNQSTAFLKSWQMIPNCRFHALWSQRFPNECTVVLQSKQPTNISFGHQDEDTKNQNTMKANGAIIKYKCQIKKVS